MITDDRRREIITDIFLSGETINERCKAWGISSGTYYMWKNRFIKDGKQLKRKRKGRVNE